MFAEVFSFLYYRCVSGQYQSDNQIHFLHHSNHRSTKHLLNVSVCILVIATFIHVKMCTPKTTLDRRKEEGNHIGIDMDRLGPC